jgi:hypothetical protein
MYHESMSLLKSSVMFTTCMALTYAEDVAPDEVYRVLDDVVDDDEVFQAFSKNLTRIINDTATPDEIRVFIHLTECISGVDILAWAKFSGIDLGGLVC